MLHMLYLKHLNLNKLCVKCPIAPHGQQLLYWIGQLLCSKSLTRASMHPEPNSISIPAFYPRLHAYRESFLIVISICLYNRNLYKLSKTVFSFSSPKTIFHNPLQLNQCDLLGRSGHQLLELNPELCFSYTPAIHPHHDPIL